MSVEQGNSSNSSSNKALSDFLRLPLTKQQQEIRVNQLQIDSRAVQPGDMFIAYPGAAVDGRQFAKNAAAAGAACVLAETPVAEQEKQWLQDLSCELITTDQLLLQVGTIAAEFYEHPSQSLDVIAVTGTNGKTSVTQLITQALDILAGNAAVVGTLGNGPLKNLSDTANTTPGAMELQKLMAQFVADGIGSVALEASSHGLEQGRLQGMAIDTAVITNLSRDHLDFHGTMEAYQGAKEILLHWPGLKHLVFNQDDRNVQAMVAKVAGSAKQLAFSLKNKQADLYANDILFTKHGLSFTLHYKDQIMPIQSRLVGEFNVANLLVVIGILLLRQYSLVEIAKVVAQLEPIAGRMELISVDAGHGGLPMVVVDYAHTPDALQQALAAVRAPCSGQLWCVFGCGGDRDKGKRSMMGKVASQLADKIILTNDNPRGENADLIFVDIKKGITPGADFTVCADREAAINEAISEAAPNDWVLIAGKGHEDYQEIEGIKKDFSDTKTAQAALEKRRFQSESSWT